MLGRIKRTSRLDAGLATAFVGLSFLAWALVAGVSRSLMLKLYQDYLNNALVLPKFSKVVEIFFVDTGIVIDIAGLLWMVGGLVLVYIAIRQKISISWAWLCAMTQCLFATIGGVIVSTAIFAPYGFHWPENLKSLEMLSQISFPVFLSIAIVIWAIFVFSMLRARYRWLMRFTGPSIRDSVKSNW